MARRVICLVILALAGTAIGCGGRPAASAPQADLDRAQAALQTALDAWKRGSPPGAVHGVAAITDPDWADGGRLMDYMIYNAEGGPHESIRCGAILSLRDKAGRTTKQDVVYSLTGTGPFVITREPGK
ncbi:MAG TPA: hypothetical protein VH120_18890 [Gemmataceae bacterium]|jgi:hypothetical protein|nr:hypothetical protein [Gemmataceae bacterium]